MPKYIRKTTRSRSSSDSLRDALLKDLEKEGQKLLKQMASQFSRDLEKEGTRVLQGLIPGSGAGGKDGASLPGIETAASLIGTLVSYAISKPKTTTRSGESSRSKEAESRFRISQSQAMLQASSELARSERNL